MISEDEALEIAQEELIGNTECLLFHIVEAKKKIWEADSIPDLMLAVRSLMENLVEDFPLNRYGTPFCWLQAEKTEDEDNPYRLPRKKEDCGQCEYAKTYGNCFEKKSAYDKVDTTRWRFVRALEGYWKVEEKKIFMGGGCPG